jgi:transposase-like protein
MSNKRRTYTHEFESEAVELAQLDENPMTEQERELELNAGLLEQWVL